MSEKDNRDLSQIPGTYGYPVVGHTFDFLKNPLTLMQNEYSKHGPVFRQSLAFQRMVATVGPDMMKLVTLDPETVFVSHGMGRAHWRILLWQFDVDGLR